MGLFSKRNTIKPTTDSSLTPITRRESPHLLPEVNFYQLANRLIDAAGDGVQVDKTILLTRIYNTVVAEATNCLNALHHPEDAQTFKALFERSDFNDQMLWDFLTTTPYRVAVHNHIVEALTDDEFQEIFVETIREGNMK